jgi:hypothetical protein
MIIYHWNWLWATRFVTGPVSGRFWSQVTSAGKPTDKLWLEFGHLSFLIGAYLSVNLDCIRNCKLTRLCILYIAGTVFRFQLHYFVIFNVKVLCGSPCMWLLTYEEFFLGGGRVCVHVCDVCACNISRVWRQRYISCHRPKGKYASCVAILLTIRFAKGK